MESFTPAPGCSWVADSLNEEQRAATGRPGGWSAPAVPPTRAAITVSFPVRRFRQTPWPPGRTVEAHVADEFRSIRAEERPDIADVPKLAVSVRTADPADRPTAGSVTWFHLGSAPGFL